MEKMKVLYKNNSGLFIAELESGLYYYGNGKNINAIGTSPNQFLRFNPYFELADYFEETPDFVKELKNEFKKTRR